MASGGKYLLDVRLPQHAAQIAIDRVDTGLPPGPGFLNAVQHGAGEMQFLCGDRRGQIRRGDLQDTPPQPHFPFVERDSRQLPVELLQQCRLGDIDRRHRWKPNGLQELRPVEVRRQGVEASHVHQVVDLVRVAPIRVVHHRLGERGLERHDDARLLPRECGRSTGQFQQFRDVLEKRVAYPLRLRVALEVVVAVRQRKNRRRDTARAVTFDHACDHPRRVRGIST